MLNFRTRKIQTRSNPSNAGTEHLEGSATHCGTKPGSRPCIPRGQRARPDRCPPYRTPPITPRLENPRQIRRQLRPAAGTDAAALNRSAPAPVAQPAQPVKTDQRSPAQLGQNLGPTSVRPSIRTVWGERERGYVFRKNSGVAAYSYRNFRHADFFTSGASGKRLLFVKRLTRLG